MARRDQERVNEMHDFNLQSIKDRAEFFRNQLKRDAFENSNKLTLKERLIAQKQERLNQDLLNRTEERRLGPTSLPFKDQIRPAPGSDGLHHKYVQPHYMTDAFNSMKNPEIEKMKSAHVTAKNLGPGIPDATMDAFRLLKKDPIREEQQAIKSDCFKTQLTSQVRDLVKQREEFNKQIREY